MKKNFSDEIKWAVIETFYQRLQILTPGSLEAEAIDHAITLALNTQRKIKNQFFFSLEILRNARYSQRRTYKRQIELYNRVNTESRQNYYPTPEEIYTAQDLENKIREAVVPHGKRFIRCWEGMLRNESIAEIAMACSISYRSVNRTRQKIREIARPFFDT